MRLSRKTDRIFLAAAVFVLAFGVAFAIGRGGDMVLARDDGNTRPAAEHYVTLEDGDSVVTVKTNARTVGELFQRAGVEVAEADIVKPSVETEIDGEDFAVSIWRARPVVIKDGLREQYLMTTEFDAREIVIKTGAILYEEDEVAVADGYNFLETGPAYTYEVTRNHVEPEPEPEPVVDLTSKLGVAPLTATRGVNIYMVNVNGRTVQRKETYYDLPMSGVMSIAARECGTAAYYEVRDDGVKVDSEGYVLVAADLGRYSRCTVVETSLGLGRVYDTGSFALSNPEQFDLATDWTNRNGK